MNKKLLELKPKRYLCPYCGQWHDWPYIHTLDCYDSESCSTDLSCDAASYGNFQGKCVFYVDGDYLNYRVTSLCSRRDLWVDSKIAIADVAESTEHPIVTFEATFSFEDKYCSKCMVRKVCSFTDEQALEKQKVLLGFEFDEDEYKQFATHLTAKNENKSTTKQLTEETTMANNFFNLSIEFGMNTDENIASTLMGIAVKSGDSWRIYDKAKGEITDLGGIELCKFPLCIMPTTKPVVGDLIKEDGEYYYVMEVAAGAVKSMHAGTGEIKTSVPIKNILGIDCYSKVVALIDSSDIAGDMDTEKLILMSAMCGQSADGNAQMNQLAPLLLLSDNLGGDDEITKIALVSAMSAQQPGEDGVPANQMSQLAPLMLLSDNLGGSDDMTKMILMSSMMSGNAAAASNPLMGFMMLKMLDKKDKGHPPTPAQLPTAPEQQPEAEETEQPSPLLPPYQQPTE